MRVAFLLLLTVLLPANLFAQEGIKPEIVTDIKAGSVYIRVTVDALKGSGSGFVVDSTKDHILIATNAHVVSPDAMSGGKPSALLTKVKTAKLTAVFNSGTKNEESATAEVIALDPAVDLAIIKVKAADIKNAPKPLKIVGAKKFEETATVYTFGFPFGEALTGNKNPGITVGKASVSSLRMNESGELERIQIDGALNPGNSGGPMTDTEGFVIGVAKSIVREGRGIGFAVPVAELNKLLKGKVGPLHASYEKTKEGKVKVTVEALVANPQTKITSVDLHYATADHKAAKPKDHAVLAALAGAKSVAMKVTDGVASGEILLEKGEGQLFFSALPVAGNEKVEASSVSAASLAPIMLAITGIEENAKPPAGWKEFALPVSPIVAWIPEKTDKPTERKGNSRLQTLTLSSTTMVTKSESGVIYNLEQLNIIGAAGKIDPAKLRDLIISSLADELNAKVSEGRDVKMGKLSAKEYTLTFGKKMAIIRIMTTTRGFYMAQVVGTEEQVTGQEGALFLASFRLAVRDPGPGPGTDPIPMPVATKGAETDVIGGAPFDAHVRDFAPAGSILIGLELGTAKWAGKDVMAYAKPIYKGKEESVGKVWGASTEKKVLKAKEGYAVGALSIQAGLNIEGVKIKFMKLDGDKLDPKDSYESEWVGVSNRPVTKQVGGTGTTFIGVQAKVSNNNDLRGLGLILNTTEGQDLRRDVGRGADTEIVGGANDKVYRDLAPEGGLLVGLEVGLNPHLGNSEQIKSIKPIFLTNGKETNGTQHGPDCKRVVTVKAKEGYAIGAVTMKAGLRLDGITVTFMKIDKDGLNTKESYTSDLMGHKDTQTTKLISGEGKLVIGITGRTWVNGEHTGLGLVLQNEKK